MFSQFFISRPRFAFVISIVITVAGLLALLALPVAQYPDITPPQVKVSASYPGASAGRPHLARALVVRPKCLLLDEPLSNLDAQLRLEMRSEIRRIVKENNLTGVYVTHDQAEALSIADRMAVMDAGRIVQVGTQQRSGLHFKKAVELVRQGEILPLETILARFPSRDYGKLLDLEVEHEQDSIVYEFKFLHADGRIIEIEVDARNGKILEQEVDD